MKNLISENIQWKDWKDVLVAKPHIKAGQSEKNHLISQWRFWETQESCLIFYKSERTQTPAQITTSYQNYPL